MFSFMFPFGVRITTALLLPIRLFAIGVTALVSSASSFQKCSDSIWIGKHPDTCTRKCNLDCCHFVFRHFINMAYFINDRNFFCLSGFLPELLRLPEGSVRGYPAAHTGSVCVPPLHRNTQRMPPEYMVYSICLCLCSE